MLVWGCWGNSTASIVVSGLASSAWQQEKPPVQQACRARVRRRLRQHTRKEAYTTIMYTPNAGTKVPRRP